MKPKNKKQKDSMEKVLRELRNNKINFKMKRREYITTKDFDVDIVFVLGGDGTFLRTVHAIRNDVPILGINLDYDYKEGGLLQSDSNIFGKHLKLILDDKIKTINVQRLEARINKRSIGYALNEFYIGYQKAYHTARYDLTLRGKTEFHKSSGILIGAAAGSTAWLKSAGGKKLPLESKKFQLIAREVFCSRLSSCSTTYAMLNEDEKVIVKSKMDHGIIVADSVKKEHLLKVGDTVEIFLSDKPITYIIF
jgi:NAD+ kinase